MKSDLCRFVVFSICIHFLVLEMFQHVNVSIDVIFIEKIVSMCICKMLRDEKELTFLFSLFFFLFFEINWFLLHYLFPVSDLHWECYIIERGFSSFANGDIWKLKFERNWHRWYITRIREKERKRRRIRCIDSKSIVCCLLEIV